MGNHRVTFAGDLDPKTVDRISELSLDSLVEASGTVSHFDAMRLMLRSDVLLLFDPEEDGKTYVRGKLYEYLETGSKSSG